MQKNITTQLQQMQEHIRDLVDIEDSLLEELCGIFNFSEVKKGENILYQGDPNNNFYFVLSGMIRFYYLTHTGKESNFAFISNNHFSCTKGGDPKLSFTVEAIEDTTYLYANMEVLQEYVNKYPSIRQFSEKIVGIYMQEREIITQSLLQDTAAKRYLDFKNRFPHLLKRLPQYHIASYLGITNVTLSRIQ